MASRRWLRGKSEVTVSLSAPRPLTTLGASRSTGPFDEVRRVYGDFATALSPREWCRSGPGLGVVSVIDVEGPPREALREPAKELAEEDSQRFSGGLRAEV